MTNLSTSASNANPILHPFDVIRHASTQSVSETNFSPTFVFYETRNGYHFRTLESLR